MGWYSEYSVLRTENMSEGPTGRSRFLCLRARNAEARKLCKSFFFRKEKPWKKKELQIGRKPDKGILSDAAKRHLFFTVKFGEEGKG